MSREVVGVVCILLFFLIIGWDVYLALDDVEANTISSSLREIPVGVRLLIPFGCGLVIGHLWW